MGQRPTQLIAQASYGEQRLYFDLGFPIDITIPIDVYGPQVNCYYGASAHVTPHTDGTNDYTLAAGSTVNSFELHTHIHCNGTHTETAQHITMDAPGIHATMRKHIFLARLITVNIDRRETLAINRKDFSDEHLENLEGVVVRTMPNPEQKKVRNYSGVEAPYFTKEATQQLVDHKIKHLIVDLPSVDHRDSKDLKAHHGFFIEQKMVRPECTITELVYIDTAIPDGLYLCQVGVLALNIDASPSRVLLYPQIGI